MKFDEILSISSWVMLATKILSHKHRQTDNHFPEIVNSFSGHPKAYHNFCHIHTDRQSFSRNCQLVFRTSPNESQFLSYTHRQFFHYLSLKNLTIFQIWSNRVPKRVNPSNTGSRKFLRNQYFLPFISNKVKTRLIISTQRMSFNNL